MYKAKITNKELINGVVSINVCFYDGTNEIYEIIKTPSLENFKSWANSRIKEFESSKLLLDEISTGDIETAVEVTPVVNTEISQEMLDKNEKIVDYINYKKLKEAIDLGVLNGTETEFIELENKVKNNITIDLIKNII